MFLALIYFFTLELSQCPDAPWGCWWPGTACPDTCSRRGWADADSIPGWHRPPNEEQQELYRLNLDQVIYVIWRPIVSQHQLILVIVTYGKFKVQTRNGRNISFKVISL